MSQRDPKQAVIEELTRPAGRSKFTLRERVALYARALRGGNVVVFGDQTGNLFEANPATIRFVKTLAIPGRRLYAVAFTDRRSPLRQARDTQLVPWMIPSAARRLAKDPDRLALVGARERPDGTWQLESQTGGGRTDPGGDGPQINFAGWCGSDGLAGGGTVHARDGDVTTVHLRFANGVELEDDVEDGLALFLTDEQVQLPGTVRLLDDRHSLIATRAAFGHSHHSM